MTAIKRQTHGAGFTLVELLIAIAIMALLGAAASILLNSSLTNKSAIEARQQRLEQLALALHIMRRDLEQVTPRIPRDEQGDPLAARMVAQQIGASSELEFVHGGRRVLPGDVLGGSLERLRYLVEDGKLIRFSSGVADPAANATWQRQVLLDDVSQFEVGLYDGQRWSTFWPPSSQLAAPLPKGVRIELDVAPWSDIRIDVLLPEVAQ